MHNRSKGAKQQKSSSTGAGRNTFEAVEEKTDVSIDTVWDTLQETCW